MATKTESIALIRSELQITDTNEKLSDIEIGERFDKALKQMSIDKPLDAKHTAIGNGNSVYRLPSDWVQGESLVSKVEYPGGYIPKEWMDRNTFDENEVDETERDCTGTATATEITLTTATDALFYKKGYPVTIKDSSNTETFYLTADGNSTTGVLSISGALVNSYTTNATVNINHFVSFAADAPGTSDFFVLHYNSVYTLTDSVDTVPSLLYNPLINLAASLCAYSIAAEYGKNTDSSIGADIVDYATKTDVWLKIGDNFNSKYKDSIRKGGKDVVPAAITVDVDLKTSDEREMVHHRSLAR